MKLAFVAFLVLTAVGVGFLAALALLDRLLGGRGPQLEVSPFAEPWGDL